MTKLGPSLVIAIKYASQGKRYRCIVLTKLILNFCYDRQENVLIRNSRQSRESHVEEQKTNLHLYSAISSFIKFLSSLLIEPSKYHVILLPC